MQKQKKNKEWKKPANCLQLQYMGVDRELYGQYHT